MCRCGMADGRMKAVADDDERRDGDDEVGRQDDDEVEEFEELELGLSLGRWGCNSGLTNGGSDDGGERDCVLPFRWRGASGAHGFMRGSQLQGISSQDKQI
ncbi:unnamed protein product [Musa acuminata var. zebrina]